MGSVGARVANTSRSHSKLAYEYTNTVRKSGSEEDRIRLIHVTVPIRANRPVHDEQQRITREYHREETVSQIGTNMVVWKMSLGTATAGFSKTHLVTLETLITLVHACVDAFIGL